MWLRKVLASAPQSVTLSQTINFTRHFTGVSALAQYFGIDLLVCDMGVKMEIPDVFYTDKMEFVSGAEKRTANSQARLSTAHLDAEPQTLQKVLP